MDSADQKPDLDTAIRFRAVALIVAQLIALLLMIGVTWRLWFPESTNSGSASYFPSIPVLGFLNGCGPVVSWVASAALLIGIVGGLVTSLIYGRSGWAKSMLLLVILLLVTESLLNQHRFLPWVLQSILLIAGYLLFVSKDFLRYARALAVSIYFYSAISKLDYQFTKTTGRQILHELTSMFGIDSTTWPEGLTDLVVLAFPLGELLVGIGLLGLHTRLVAMLGGIGMHLVLILVLGPWGLKNAESVLIWNALFASQLFLMYWPVRLGSPNSKNEKGSKLPNDVPVETRGKTPKRYWVLTCFVCLFPLLEKFDAIDHWPAWGLYSPRASRCRLFVAEWKLEQMPDELQELFKESGDAMTRLREFDFARWSIAKLNAPVYPQDRFQFALAKYLVKKFDLDRTFMIELQSASNWWDGKRQVQKISSLDELEKASLQFWVNDRIIVAERK